MFDIINILFFIIVIGIIITRVQRVKKLREEEDPRQGAALPSSQPVYRSGGGGISPSSPVMQTRTVQQIRGGAGASTASRGGSASTAPRGTGAPATAVINGVLDTDGDGQISTTEYLAQKAREDEYEHQRDEYETKQKLTQGGRLQLGGRIPDDGLLPRGTRMVYCGYCGAENVLPQHAGQKAYHCYFCHEQL